MILTTILIFFLSFTIYEYIKSIIVLKKSKLPSLPLFPVIGHTPYFFGKTDVFVKKITKLSEMFVGSLGLFVGTYFIAIFHNPKDITTLANNTGLQTKAKQYDFLKIALGNGILVSSGTSYKQSKKVLIEAVCPANMKGYIKSFNEQAKLLADSLKPRVGLGEFKMDDIISFRIFKNLLGTIMGLDSNIMTDAEIFRYNQQVADFTSCVFQRFYTVWLYPDFIFKMSNLYKRQKKIVESLHSVTDQMILNRKKQIEKNDFKNVNKVFVDKFFTSKKENGEDFTIEDIRSDVLSLFGAGLETTVVSLSYVIMLLAIHKDVQQKVYEELINTLGDNNNDLTLEDLHKLTYMEQVLNETWRLYTPLPALARKVTNDIKLSQDRLVEKGTTLCIPLGLLHRNPTVFTNPNTFNPENFSPENVQNRPANSFIPFGIGSRKCIGGLFAKFTIKVMLAHLLRNFVLNTSIKEGNFRISMEITLKNKTGTIISIQNRKSE